MFYLFRKYYVTMYVCHTHYHANSVQLATIVEPFNRLINNR